MYFPIRRSLPPRPEPDNTFLDDSTKANRHVTVRMGIERETLGRRTARSTGIVVITNHDVASST